MSNERDDLEQLVADSEAEYPGFRKLVDEEKRRIRAARASSSVRPAAKATGAAMLATAGAVRKKAS